MEGKHSSESRVTLGQFMQPEHANNLGNAHGGEIMKLIDEAGGLCCTRHARRPSVTVAVDSITFLEPVHVGDLVTVTAELTYVGRTSMETEVCVEAEDLLSGKHRLTNRAYLVYVALGDDGKPTPVTPLIVETGEEKRRYNEARQRQAERLARKEREARP